MIRDLDQFNMKHSWKTWLAAGGGAGYLPFATGTWGSLVGLLPLLPFYGKNELSTHAALLCLVVIGLFIGTRVAAELEPEWGSDPKAFVWDEVIGQWLTMIGHAWNWQNMLIGFLLFRLFDILKPLGIRRLESLKHGWGVMLDDVAAGLVANGCLYLINYFWLQP
jgi:phosphatidylglycerophosphatase A